MLNEAVLPFILLRAAVFFKCFSPLVTDLVNMNPEFKSSAVTHYILSTV